MRVLCLRPDLALSCAVLLTGAALSACGPAGGRAGADAAAAPSASTDPASATAGYAAPPTLDSAQRGADGLTLAGEAPAGAQVRLASPSAPPLTAQADGQGHWSLKLATVTAPALFALSAQRGDRLVRGEGALVMLPPPGPPAVLARAGFAALPIGAASASASIVAVDFDAGGGAAVAGFAKPMAGVRLSFDGAAAGLSQADETGRFGVVAANRPLAPGMRRIEIEADGGARAEVSVPVSRPLALDGQAYRAARLPGAWRIDWAPAGGGVQTTVVFDAPSAAAGGSKP